MEQQIVAERQKQEATMTMNKKLTILVTEEQRRRYHIAAATAGVTLSDVVRNYLDAWATEVIGA